METRKPEGIVLSYRPARLHGLAEPIPGLVKSLKIIVVVHQFIFEKNLRNIFTFIVTSLK
jgi:hypothetical protein